MWPLLPRLFKRFFPSVQARHLRRQSSYPRPGLEVLEERRLLSAYIFTDANNDNSWGTPGNWSVNGVQVQTLPGSHDTAFIPGNLLANLGSTTVAGVTVAGTLNLSGKLSVTAFSSPGTFNITPSGELDNVGYSDFGGGGTISGQIDAGGSGVTFDMGSFMTLATGAKLTGLGVFTINGAVTNNAALSQDSPIYLNNDGGYNSYGSLTGSGSLSVGGEFDWNGGVLGLSGGITLQPNAGFKTQGSDGKELTSGTLTSLALVTELGGTGTLIIDGGSTFDNEAGEVDVTLPYLDMPGGSYGPGLFLNNANGILKLETVGTLEIQGAFSNQGTMDVSDGTTAWFLNMAFANVNLDGTLQLGGDIQLTGPASSPTGLIINAGAGTFKIGGSSTLSLPMGANIFGNLEVENGGTLTSGDKVTNSGKLTLDEGAQTNLSAYQQTSDGTLELQASSDTSSSSLSVGGDAELSGTLDMVFENGYVPVSGTVFPVLTAGSVSAHFDTTPDNMMVGYSPTSVSLTQQ